MAGDVLVGTGQAEPGGHVAPTKQGNQWAALWGCHILGTRDPGGHTHLGAVLQGHAILGTWLPGGHMDPAPMVL